MRPKFWSALVLGLACSAIAVPASAQFIIDHESSGKRLRGLHGPASPAIRRSFESDREAAAVFREILAATGIPGVADRIQVRASAETANAEAQIGEDGQRYIFYNSTFMRELGARTRQFWSQVFVIAHEVGHHIAGHLDFAGQNHRVELEADRYAGFILGRMGATHDEAIAAIGAIGTGAGSSTHPPRDQRVQIVSLGWNDGATGPGQQRSIAAPPVPPPSPPSVAATPPPTQPPPTAALPPVAKPSPSAPSAGPRGSYAWRGSTRLEGSLITTSLQVDVDGCRRTCDHTTACVGYQYGGTPPLTKTCQLFSDVKGRAIDGNWGSGLREDLARSVSVIPLTSAGPSPQVRGVDTPTTTQVGPLTITKSTPLTVTKTPPPAASPAKSVEAPLRFGYKTRTNAGIVGDLINEGRVDSPVACLLMCMNTSQCSIAGFTEPAAGQVLCKIYREGARLSSDQPGAVTVIFKP
jgi:hypothetical protein